MSLFHDAKKSAYRAIRGASHGAAVSLLRQAGEYVATFACATAIASALGTQAVAEEGIPTYRIAVEEMHAVCAKLAQRLSIALVDVGMVNFEVGFVLLWRIECVPPAVPKTFDLSEY